MATSIAIKPPSLVETFANRHGIDAGKVLSMLTETAFNQGKDAPLTPAETQAALIICNTYDLNPMLREIFVFRSKGKLLVYVPVDGWATIINRQANFDGMEFEEHFEDIDDRSTVEGNSGQFAKKRIYSVTCTMYRKDRSRPTRITEYWHECKRDTEPWKNMPIRMTRNRSMIQCARLAFSISGIVDEDEAATIEGFPSASTLEPTTKWDDSQAREITMLLNGLNWSFPKTSSFTKQYADRPTEAIAYLKKEQERFKRVTPKAEKQEPKPEPEPQQDAGPAAETEAEKAVEW